MSKRQIAAGLLALGAMGHALADGELKPFTSDGCSLFPDGTIEQQELWHTCCVAHDLAYWAGGTEQQREAADLELKACVAAVGEPAIAELMLQGVTVGGLPWWPTPFRWGYGWPWPRGYGELSDEERRQVEAILAIGSGTDAGSDDAGSDSHSDSP